MKTRVALLGIDFLFLSLSFFLSFRWFHPSDDRIWFFYLLFMGIKSFFFIRLGLYHAILRFAGLPLAATILKATALASVLCFLIIQVPTPHIFPSGFFITDYLITTFFVGLVRFAPRYFFESWRGTGSKRILIYGAGELGEQVARKLFRDPGEYHLVGFLDDDPSKIGKRVHNLPIFGPMSQLNSLIADNRISELIIAISFLDGEALRKLTRECRRNGVFCRIVPTFSDMLKKEVSIQNIDISDLLRRKPKDLDEGQIRNFVKNKNIMITGAAGSIGSELTRQCIRYGAKKLILIDHSEYNLYSLKEELSTSTTPTRFCLLNVLGNGHLKKIFSEEKPSLIFHAAAYKHVPLVEDNPFEGIINNVFGTIQTALLAEEFNVEKFVLISTDKAVRPASIMGASKRIAELYVQNLNTKSKTEFLSVRFGNVLGSSGSVIPKFIEQINRGGPVTVTDPEVSRYFMLISEAVQLVLQAASIGRGGEIFILNMGRPIRILEMAEDLIFLSGLEPHKDIKIEFTGLRPGEKLYEELLIDESEGKTQYENITIGRAINLNWDDLTNNIETLLYHSEKQNLQKVLESIKMLVPEFAHRQLGTTDSNSTRSARIALVSSQKTFQEN